MAARRELLVFVACFIAGARATSDLRPGLYSVRYRKAPFFDLSCQMIVGPNTGKLDIQGSIQYQGELPYSLARDAQIQFQLPESLQQQLSRWYTVLDEVYVQDGCPIIVVRPLHLKRIRLQFDKVAEFPETWLFRLRRFVSACTQNSIDWKTNAMRV